MSTSGLNLALGFHSHLPLDHHKIKTNDLDNESSIKYLSSLGALTDLIDSVSNFEGIKTNFHLSGNVITFLDKKYSDFSSKIRNLLDSNQLELLSGGLYEPIFPSIPKEDRQTQILQMSRLINHIYGYSPRGAWITESVWEPSLTLDLAKARIEYTCLPKEYFTSVGMNNDELSGYFVTEEEGRKIGVFPVSYNLNILMGKHLPQEVIDLLIASSRNHNSDNPFLVLLYEHKVTDKSRLNWLINFFELLEKENDSINTVLLGDYYLKNKPKGRIYLGTHQENESQHLTRYWNQFLLKYPEANLLHKKMLRISKKINAAKEGKSRFKVIKEMINQAQDLLLKGQANNAYWDNKLQGIYSPNERHNTYSNLIKAENLIDAASRQVSKWLQVVEIDYDCDGNDEIIIETETQNIYISPALGGTILEHDFRPKNINLLNVISRKKENYHNQNGELIYDSYPKLNLIEHYFENEPALIKLKSNQLPMPSLTKNILNPYKAEIIKAKEESCKIRLNSIVNLINLEGSASIEITKQFSTRSGDSLLLIDYILTSKSSSTINFFFAVEFNINYSGNYNKESYFYLKGDPNYKTQEPFLKSSEEIKDLDQISLHDKKQGVDLTISFSKNCNLYRFPIETVSYNFESLESIYQGSTILSSWHLIIEPNTSWDLTIKENISTRTEEL